MSYSKSVLRCTLAQTQQSDMFSNQSFAFEDILMSTDVCMEN